MIQQKSVLIPSAALRINSAAGTPRLNLHPEPFDRLRINSVEACLLPCSAGKNVVNNGPSIVRYGN